MNGISVMLLASTLLAGGAFDDHIEPDIDQPIFLDYSYRNKIDYVLVEPIKNSTCDMRMIVKVSFSKNLNENATVTISTHNDKYLSYVTLTTLTTSEKQATLIYSYDKKYTSSLYNVNVFRFKLHSEYGDDQVEIDIGEYDFTPQTINSVTYSYESPKNIGVYQNGRISYQSEKIEAKKCYEDIYLTSFKPFDLNGFELIHKCPFGYEMLDINPYLAIYSEDVLFPNLGKGTMSGKLRSIPLTYSKDKISGKITFAYKDQLYVNPTNLDMSSTPKEGYIKTNQIYFPTYLNEDKSIRFTYTIANFGANSYPFAYNEKVHVSKKIFGNCGDSSFCITTSESDPDVDLGEKISR